MTARAWIEIGGVEIECVRTVSAAKCGRGKERESAERKRIHLLTVGRSDTAPWEPRRHSCDWCDPVKGEMMRAIDRDAVWGVTADGTRAVVSRWVNWEDRGDGGHACGARCRRARGNDCECECRGGYHGIECR